MNKLREQFEKETGLKLHYGTVEKYVEWLENHTQQLINVKDRLPDKPGHYLVLAPLSFPKNCKFMVAEFYDDNNTFYSESSDNPLEDVTHWAELPQEK